MGKKTLEIENSTFFWVTLQCKLCTCVAFGRYTYIIVPLITYSKFYL